MEINVHMRRRGSNVETTGIGVDSIVVPFVLQ
jgi:hypothetical protein